MIYTQRKIKNAHFLPHPLDFCDPTLNFSKHPCMYSYFSNHQPLLLPQLFFLITPFWKCCAPDNSDLISIYLLFIIYLSQNAHIFEPLFKKKFNTVCNRITISIVFTNKNGMDRFTPLPPPSMLLNYAFVFKGSGSQPQFNTAYIRNIRIQ